MVRESRTEKATKRYDVPGAVLVTGGLVSLVYGFTEAAKPGVGWGALSTVVFLVVAVALLVGFVITEARSPHALLPLHVVLERNRGGSYLSSLLVGGGLFAMFLFLTYYLQLNLGYSALKSGFAFLPFSAGIVVGAGIASGALPKIGPKPLLFVGGVMSVLGLFYLVTLTDSTSWLTHVLPAEILISIGMGLTFVVTSSLALYRVDDNDSGVASAMLNTSQQVGGSLGTALLNTLFASAVTNYIADARDLGGGRAISGVALATIRGYHVAFAVGAGMLALSTVIVLVLVNARQDELEAVPAG